MNKLPLRYICIISFVLLSSIFLLHYKVVGQAVYGDGRFYWAYMRSAWKDHDLDLRDELNREYSPRTNNALPEKPTEKKQIFNWFPIGPSVAWFPSFIFADAIASLMHIFNPSFPNNGYSDVYQIIVGLENVLFVSAGITVLYRLLTVYFNPFVSLITIVLTLFGTNLLFYGGVDVINSHPVSFLLSSLFLYFWMKTRTKRKTFDWIVLGSLLGFLAMNRTQDAIFGLLLLFDFLFQKTKFVKKFREAVLTGISCLVIFSPQILMWKYVFGSYFMSPYLLGGFNFIRPHIVEVLLNTRNGLFIWTPLYLFSFIGLYMVRRKFFPLVCISVALLYLITAWSGWNQGSSFSIRMMITGLPALSFGLAAFFTKMKSLLRPVLFYTLCVGFIVYNCMSIVLFLLVK